MRYAAPALIVAIALIAALWKLVERHVASPPPAKPRGAPVSTPRPTPPEVAKETDIATEVPTASTPEAPHAAADPARRPHRPGRPRAEQARPRPEPRVILHLRVQAVGGPETGPVNVTLTSAEAEADHPSRASGRIELGRPQDLECSIDEVWPLDDAMPRVRVKLDHPDYLPLSLIILLKRGRRGETDVLEADVSALLQPAGVITGTVCDSRNTPAVRAKAAVYVDMGGGRHPGAEVGQGSCDEQGRYRIRVSAEGPVLIVASLSGHAPGFVDACARAGIVAAAPPLRLSEGFSIRGRVSAGMDLPLEGWRIEVRPDSGGYAKSFLRLMAVNAVWCEGRPWAAGSSISDDGRYEITGLSQGRYVLFAEPDPSMPCARDYRVGSSHSFDAPNDAAHIRLDLLAVLCLDVRLGGERPGFAVPIALLPEPADKKQGRYRVQTDAKGELRLPVMPGTEWRAYVGLPGFSLRNESFTAPQAGRTRSVYLDLFAQDTGGRLLISVCNDLGRILPADCRLSQNEVEVPDVLFVALEGSGSPRPRLLPDRPSLTLEDLPAGTYRVTATHPGHLSASRTVEVEGSRMSVVRLTLRSR